MTCTARDCVFPGPAATPTDRLPYTDTQTEGKRRRRSGLLTASYSVFPGPAAHPGPRRRRGLGPAPGGAAVRRPGGHVGRGHRQGGGGGRAERRFQRGTVGGLLDEGGGVWGSGRVWHPGDDDPRPRPAPPPSPPAVSLPRPPKDDLRC